VGGRLIYDIISALREPLDFKAVIIGVDSNSQAAGRLLCDKFYCLPSAEDAPQRFMECVNEIHLNNNIDVILALSEPESRLLSKQRDSLNNQGIKISPSSWQTVRDMTDKLLMLKRLYENDVHSMPFYQIDNSDHFDEAIEACSLGKQKVVVKPRRGRGSRGVMIIDPHKKKFEQLLPDRFCGIGCAASVKEAMNKNNFEIKNLICVPYINGPVFDVDCISIKGEMMDFSARRRQLKNPLWPTSTGHKIDLNPDVRAYAKTLCKVFEVDGAADFDIAIDEVGNPVLFDAGSRFSGSVGGSFTAGGNFPAQLVRALLELPLQKMEIRDKTVLRPFITMAEIPIQNEDDLL
jgi:carbamoylphosphate synthase large subunit